MKKNWLNILFYGLALGLLLAALELLQYKWVFVKNSVEVYAGLIAGLFTGIGIWAGKSLWKRKPVVLETTISPVFEPSESAIAKLGLTPRELEVLQLMAQGLSSQEIADHLFVSLNTVKTHISNVLSKFNAARRTQAIQQAKMLRIIS